jgi:ubiquinone/menaquinone biosynthesis C-methylase UbiE
MIFDERLVISEGNRADIINDEHLVRYKLAAKLAAGKTVLDIACGSGYGSKILSEAGAAKVIAVDINKEAVAEAEKRYGAEDLLFKSGNAEKIEEADETFDLAVSFETIEHLPDAEKYLAEISRVLKKEGMALISTPNKDVFGQKNPYHLHEFTGKEFEDTLKKYFANVLILEQANGLASVIKAPDAADKKAELSFSNFGAPLYFIAICSQAELPENLPIGNIASLNPAALERLKNNPVLKFVDKIYSLIRKI